MNYYTIIKPFVSIAIFSTSVFITPYASEISFPADKAGTEALRNGSFQAALDELTKNAGDPDTTGRLFKLGIASSRIGDTAKALAFFRTVTQKDQALAPLAWKEMGALLNKKHPDSALACYKRALATPVPNRFRNGIFERLRPLIKDDTLKIARTPYYGAYLSWWHARRPSPPEPLCGRFDTLLAGGKWPVIDSLVNSAFAGLNDSLRRVIVRMIDRKGPLDSVVSTASLYLLGRIAMDCGLFEIAERMLAAAQRKPDFTACVTDQSFLRFRGRLSFYQKQYGDAISTLSKYIDRFGSESDLVLLIARAYYKLDRLKASAEWYDRFIGRATDYPGLAEILWMRAWIDEQQDLPVSAKVFYQRIYASFPKSRRAEESRIRHALCFYRLKKFDSAVAVLSAFEKQVSSSSFLPAAQYWKAQNLLKLKANDSAKTLLVTVATREPYDYYAYRARELLTLMGDSTTGRLSLDTVYDVTQSIAWLDSIAPPGRKMLAPEDSVNLRRGLLLAIVGKISEASLFIEPLELSYVSNLLLEYKIGSFYRTVEAQAEAAMAGRRLSWRIPLEARSDIPLPVYALIYPRPFLDIVKREAAEHAVDPCFVFAVMRQESTFDPDVISPAGAIGLMQIMPATGKTIARELQVPYAVDSLFKPAVSIKFGAYYLSQLLDQFNENEVLALASYNAGPTNAMGWYLRNREKDIDLFVEDIDFSETRNYVKKVLGNYWFYLKLARVLPDVER
jgi:tetratricopeptide (TPR) repeat protein